MFFGRNDKLLELEQWILEERCRAIAILGMGGIGKTDLSLELAKGIQARSKLSSFVLVQNLR
ncbi:MAG: hypothetical protein SVX43_23200 [Cyanobacteriota bacterium]|nr:hypothetical protein [Cyanobacteriota bacterium]